MRAAFFSIAACTCATSLNVGVSPDGFVAPGGGSRFTPAAWVEPYDPLPWPNCTITHGFARFTVITPALLRFEFSPHSPPVFHDAGTFFAVNRRAREAPRFSARVLRGGTLELTTSALTVFYDPSAAPPGSGFTAATLRVALADGRSWRAGDAPAGSLHGTIRTLDRVGKTVGLGCTQPAYRNDSHCEEGVASRDGWAVIDDSLGPRWEGGAPPANAARAGGWPWVSGPAEMPTAAGAAPPAAACAARGFERFECLWGNVVDEAACRARGCCYDPAAAAEAHGQPPAIHMTPWCFWPDGGALAAAYTDLYFFGHGGAHRAALRDFAVVGGRTPLLPRWALGPFFSRWFAYADFEERGVVNSHARNGIPLDVQVLDTDWHMGWWYEHGWPPHPPRFPDGPPPAAHPIQWTGWDVNTHLLPAVARLHAHLHARGVATGWNFHLPPYVHKSGGVQYIDSVYRELAGALGLDADEGLPILGDYSNKSWVEPFFNIAVERLLVGMDVDFAWPDWQQGEWTRMLGLPPTPWLSYLFASAPRFARPPSLRPPPAQPAERGLPSAAAFTARSMVLNRWGGLGAHRYPVGFSGDAETTWEVLRLQAYITSTAANVAFQWSHDIGGFAGSPDPEIMTRWVQLGVLSPVLRPHCAGRGGNSRDIWKFEWSSFEVMKAWFRFRARLVPYLAEAARSAYEGGVVPVHPLYYDFPDVDGAYGEGALHQYKFGEGMWVAPITAPAPSEPGAAGLAPATIWFPPGAWIEWFSWQAHSAPAEGAAYDRRFTLEEAPVFSRPGAVIPLRTLDGTRGGVGTAVDVPEALTLWVLPVGPAAALTPGGAPLAFSARVYDDDGVSTAYAEAGAWTETRVACAWHRGAGGADGVNCTIAPPAGRLFAEFPERRSWTFRFIATWPPEAVVLNGAPVPLEGVAAPDAWGDGAAWPRAGAAWAYAGYQASTWVHTGPLPAGAPVALSLRFPPGAPVNDPLLTSALPRKMARAAAAKTAMNLASWSVHPVDVPAVLAAAGAGAAAEDAVWRAAAAGAPGGAAAEVRKVYEALAPNLAKGVQETEALLAKGVGGAPVETMRGLLQNALA